MPKKFAGPDSSESFADGDVPRLRALCLHNGTVYRWNRACYGITDGKPHLRIENRVLPAGPTVLDEVANAALWFGLISGVLERYGNIADHMSFDDARRNFLSAARQGLDAQLAWVGAPPVPADRLAAGRRGRLSRYALC